MTAESPDEFARGKALADSLKQARPAGLARLVRPNGKPYVARKPPRVVRDVYCEDDGETYVMVLRTHDVEQAVLLAGAHRVVAGSQRLTWERVAMRWGELRWTADDERGMPCVVFVENEESYG